MSADIIPAPVRCPTKGRTISLANPEHPPEGKRINALSMSERHGIISAGYIPVPIYHPAREAAQDKRCYLWR